MNSADVDVLYETALWWKRLRESSNDAFLPLFADRHRYLILKGGGGSGKSIFAGRKIIERCVSEEGHRILVCRKVGRTLRESCFKQLCAQAAEAYPDLRVKINRSDMLIVFPNGSEIIFSGLDDVEKLKSIYNVTSIWIEEASEITKRDFDQLDIRLRGETKYYKQMILTFNPVSILHWLKSYFFDFDIPAGEDRDGIIADTRTHESTYKDNRFLDEHSRRILERYKSTDEYYYTVYCLGQWGVTGKSVFDSRAISERLAKKIVPLRVGAFEYRDDGTNISDIVFTPSADGFIKIFKEPEAGVPYVLGGDTAGDGSDSFVGQVIDNRTGEQVAVLRRQFDEDIYAAQMFALGRYYNDALIGIENNYSTYPTAELERRGYPNLYIRTQVDSYTHAYKKSYGFVTNSKTRPLIVSTLIKAVRDDIEILNDETTMQEMLTFVRREDNTPAAENGAHDDTVMALAIAHYIRPQQSYVISTGGGEDGGADWTDDMWEDYNSAPPEIQKYLIGRWGRPKSR